MFTHLYTHPWRTQALLCGEYVVPGVDAAAAATTAANPSGTPPPRVLRCGATREYVKDPWGRRPEEDDDEEEEKEGRGAELLEALRRKAEGLHPGLRGELRGVTTGTRVAAKRRWGVRMWVLGGWGRGWGQWVCRSVGSAYPYKTHAQNVRAQQPGEAADPGAGAAGRGAAGVALHGPGGARYDPPRLPGGVRVGSGYFVHGSGGVGLGGKIGSNCFLLTPRVMCVCTYYMRTHTGCWRGPSWRTTTRGCCPGSCGRPWRRWGMMGE